MILNIVLIITLVVLLLISTGWIINRIQLARWKRRLFASENNSVKITDEDLERFPELMRVYLKKAGVMGHSKNTKVSFRQKGVIKTDPKKKWLNFTALQFMCVKPGGFVWNAQSFPLKITDSYFLGVGKIRVNLLGLLNLAVYSTPETNQSALGRYFGELLWFPIGFLDEDISWEAVNDSSVKGMIQKDGLKFSGYFHFKEDGIIHSFTGKRHRDLLLEDFEGRASDYTLMDGLLIPKKMTAIWNLDSGSLEYFKATIEAYNLLE